MSNSITKGVVEFASKMALPFVNRVVNRLDFATPLGDSSLTPLVKKLRDEKNNDVVIRPNKSNSNLRDGEIAPNPSGGSVTLSPESVYAVANDVNNFYSRRKGEGSSFSPDDSITEEERKSLEEKVKKLTDELNEAKKSIETLKDYIKSKKTGESGGLVGLEAERNFILQGIGNSISEFVEKFKSELETPRVRPVSIVQMPYVSGGSPNVSVNPILKVKNPIAVDGISEIANNIAKIKDLKATLNVDKPITIDKFKDLVDNSTASLQLQAERAALRQAKEERDIEMHALKVDDLTFKKTAQVVKDLDGEYIAKVAPRDMALQEKAINARLLTDENQFEIEPDDFVTDDLFFKKIEVESTTEKDIELSRRFMNV